MSSPRTVERLSRILSMLPWVIAHQGATVAEVCERFGYTKLTKEDKAKIFGLNAARIYGIDVDEQQFVIRLVVGDRSESGGIAEIVLNAQVDAPGFCKALVIESEVT